MKNLSFVLVFLGLLLSGCASTPYHPRQALVDSNNPFGLSWSLTTEEKARYLDVEDPAECADLFDKFEGAEKKAKIKDCLQANRIKVSEQLPHPIKNGFLDVLYMPDGTVIARSHIFGIDWIPYTSEAAAQKQADIVKYNLAQWMEALELNYGTSSARGIFFNNEFTRIDDSFAPCNAWYVGPVVILLCSSRTFTPFNSISSLQFVRVDRSPTGRALRAKSAAINHQSQYQTLGRYVSRIVEMGRFSRQADIRPRYHGIFESARIPTDRFPDRHAPRYVTLSFSKLRSNGIRFPKILYLIECTRLMPCSWLRSKRSDRIQMNIN